MVTLIWMADSNQTVTSFEFVIFCSLGCWRPRCCLFSFISAAWHSWPRGHKRFSSFHTLHFDGGTPPPEDGEKLIDEEEEAVVVVADFDVAPGFMAYQARLSVRASRGRTEKEDSLAVARRLQSHSWANSQKPAKVKVENFVKLTCVCNDLTSFEYEAQATGNRILQLFVLIFFNESATNNLRQININNSGRFEFTS